MKKYIVKFVHRGALFGGCGPVITAIIFFIMSKCIDGLTFSGQEILTAMVSTYFLAFIHAGVSVFNQVEEWSVSKSTLFHLLTLYLAYVICYLINSWIPFDLIIVGIFTLSFVVIYAVIWIIVVLSIKATEKRLNKNLKKEDLPGGRE